MSLKLVFKASIGQFDKAFQELYAPGAKAATAAIRDAAEIVKRDGRASIGAAGFGSKWQNTLRVDVYPKGKPSMNAAAWVYHKIPYATVFEDGATIRGKPKLWIPLDSAPKRIGRNRVTPKVIARAAGANVLFPITKGNRTYLAARVRMSKAKAAEPRPKVTLAQLRASNRIGPQARVTRRGLGAASGVLRSVPLFVGVNSVDIKKRFKVREVCAKAADQLASLYLKHFEGN